MHTTQVKGFSVGDSIYIEGHMGSLCVQIVKGQLDVTMAIPQLFQSSRKVSGATTRRFRTAKGRIVEVRNG